MVSSSLPAQQSMDNIVLGSQSNSKIIDFIFVYVLIAVVLERNTIFVCGNESLNGEKTNQKHTRDSASVERYNL
jgi:hypothetical protein